MMQVLKVVAEGAITSFRRPHFMLSIQPTFRMPPPATIYGHICSTLGDLVAPEDLQFAYHFTARTAFSDLEHTIMLEISSGKLEGTKYPKVLEAHVQPFKRELLFQPRLTLYINRPKWIDAFRSPRYAVVLGRSQDLFTYTSLEIIELEQAEHAYFEHTLLPYTMATQVGQGVTELLPRYIDYEHKRVPTFARYVFLENRVHSSDFWFSEQKTFWVDPASPQYRGDSLGLMFHSFVGEQHETILLA